MIPALALVALFALVVVLGAADADRADHVILYTMGLVLIVRVWAWPNDLRKADYRPLHHRHGSPAMVGQPGPAGMIVAELRRARTASAELAAAAAERAAAERGYWVAVCS